MIEGLPLGCPELEFVRNVLPLGAHVKPNGSVRMLVGPSLPGVNSAMADLPCRLPTIEHVMHMIEPGWVLGKRDLMHGFFHCVLDPEARKSMGFRHPVSGKLYRWVVLPQGTKQSPAIFCAVSEAAACIFTSIFASLGIECKVIVYVDDFILAAKNHMHLVAAFNAMDAEAGLLGLQFNPAKDAGKLFPLTRLEALGLEVDSVTLELHLPESKKDLYLQAIHTFHSNHSGAPRCPQVELEQLVGKLVFTCKVCRWGFIFIQGMLDALYPVMPGPAPPHPSRWVDLTEAVWSDLRFWQLALGVSYSKWGGIRRHMLGRKEWAINPTNFTAELFTDASGSWGVGGVFGLEVLSQKWEKDTKAIHIGALELEAVMLSLRHWKHDLYGQEVLVRCDNIQAVVAINKGASRKQPIRDLLLELALLGLEFNFNVKSLHVKGVDNPADAPSRGKSIKSAQDYTFVDFARFNTPPAEIDCCAAISGYNVHEGCDVWSSAANPVECNVSAMVGKALWATVPFANISAVLACAREA